jgi:chemotaxis protein CheY-P-specific phosphatase CheC
MGGTVLLLVAPADADAMCRMLGLEPGDEYAVSALGEIGNIVGASYINALASMTGMELEPTPPATARCCSTRTWWSRARTARSPSCWCPTRAASTSSSRGLG